MPTIVPIADCAGRRPRGSFGPVYTQACARAHAPSTVVPRAASGAPTLSVASTRTGPKSSAIITAPGEKCGLGIPAQMEADCRDGSHTRRNRAQIPTKSAQKCRGSALIGQPARFPDRTGQGCGVIGRIVTSARGSPALTALGLRTLQRRCRAVLRRRLLVCVRPKREHSPPERDHVVAEQFRFAGAAADARTPPAIARLEGVDHDVAVHERCVRRPV